jgi:hypothetical protein
MKFYRQSQSEDYRVKIHRLSFSMTKETPAPDYERLVACMLQGSSSGVRQEPQVGKKGRKGKGEQSQPMLDPDSADDPPPKGKPKGKSKDKKGKGRWMPKMPMTRSPYPSQGWR